MRRAVTRRLLRAASGEEGTATIEFVIVFPLFISLFLAAFELGLLQVRHTMLERGLDIAVRQLRVSTATPPDYDTVKDQICENALIVPNCAANLKLEMVRMNLDQPLVDLPTADCVDRAEDIQPVRSWVAGKVNDLMVLRACLLFDPFFPSTGLGYQLAQANANGGAYALTALTAYVSEPE